MKKSILIFTLLWLGLWFTDILQVGISALFPAAGAEPEATPGHPALAQGVILIAGKNLVDPNFSRSVILITEYDADGTAGLILNKRTKLSATHLLPQLGSLAAQLDDIHVGGPVALDHIHLLVQSASVPQGAKPVVDDIFIVDSMETLKQLELGNSHEGSIRVFMGFAGWAPGQLETELLRGDWYIWPATSTIIFSKFPENIWYELIYLATAKWT